MSGGASPVAAFTVGGGHLQVGGVSVEMLAERVGSTPFFAYDRTLLTERVELLRRTLPSGVSLSYAVKANPMAAVLQHLSQLIDGFDVASSFEMLGALNTTIPPARISFAGPGKTPAELRQAVAAGVTVELESNTEMRRVVDVGEELGVRPSVALRVNPNFEVKGSGMRMGGGPQQFGVDAEDVPALLRDTRLAGLDFKGFHVFAGSQNLMAEVIVQAQRRSVEMVAALSEHAPGPITYLNLGGGFGIPYSSRDKPLELEVVGDGLQVLLDTMIGPLLGHPRTVIELGRYIVGECGVYVTRIVDRKTSRGRVFLVVDGGMHHQLAASGNLGQVIRRNYPLAIGNRMGVVAEETATVVGCLCTPLDILGDRVEVPRADIGDLVVVFQAGAYGLTASPTAFLGHPMPAEVLL